MSAGRPASPRCSKRARTAGKDGKTMPRIATGAAPTNARAEQPEPAPAAALGDLSLPPKAAAALAEAGVQSAADLADKSEADLLAIPGVGPATVEAIKAQAWPTPEKDDGDG